MAQKRFKPPLRLICTVGTLAHNRAFTAAEMAQYARSVPGGHAEKARPTLAWMLKHKLLKRDGNGTYYPTMKGWNTVEKACRR